jgi:hypothetical protein
MPYLHCTECHHEYEAISKDQKCDWCGSKGYVLEEKTPLEKTNFKELLNKLTGRKKEC